MYYIYLIVNKINGKTYVGQRKSSKEWYNDSYMGSGIRLGLAKKKYGIENFEKFLVQYCYSKEETDKAEKFWIAEYRSRGKAEYNIANGGDGGYTGPCSEETRRKRSKSMKGKNKGKKMSEEAIKKMSESLKGHTPWNKGKTGIFSESALQKIGEAHKGIEPPNKGKHHTEEAKRKMSEAHKGKPAHNKGKHHTEEAKIKMSNAHKGISPANKGKHLKIVDGKREYS